MSSFNANLMEYNIITENELAQILSQYDTNYVFSVVDDALKSRFLSVPIVSTRPNAVSAWEQNFKALQAYYGSEGNSQISSVRQDTYMEIIDTICKEFGLEFTTDETVDIYSAALYLYDFLVCRFSENMINFFTNYIYKERNTIFNALDMADLKKNKDSSTIYSKKIYKDNKLAIINANIDTVMNYICTIDIPFDTVIYNVFGMNSDLANYILNIISSIDNDFFIRAYGSLLNTDIRSEIITAVRIKLKDVATSHEMANDINDITSSYIKNNNVDDDDIENSEE